MHECVQFTGGWRRREVWVEGVDITHVAAHSVVRDDDGLCEAYLFLDLLWRKCRGVRVACGVEPGFSDDGEAFGATLLHLLKMIVERFILAHLRLWHECGDVVVLRCLPGGVCEGGDEGVPADWPGQA